ncbi:MAG: TonB-dependent receptor plug domain-containing protein, partial [Deltaproteobacteria bacterium]|nr:TonB-dependent receptor plug domain-containing protein [Deltaproteobacteria bacterium]
MLGKRTSQFVACLAAAYVLAGSARGQSSFADLTRLSLEELMNVEVTSAAKKEQKLSAVAAAIYVITQEDIRRSGATSIPEALRMVPGLSVARVDANKWAISARGFNSFFANKLLVLMDGRSVYTPLFSGVFWDVQDAVLEDVDRIEIIRGPAGSLWGANAVNGVINIITKNAKDTQGGLLSGGGGNEERGFGQLRYGAKLADDVFFRAYGKYFNRDNFKDTFPGRANDQWHVGRGGFRLDAGVGEKDSITLQGNYYDGQFSNKMAVTSLTPPLQSFGLAQSPMSGGNLVGRWRHIISATSDLELQVFYDRTERDTPLVSETRQTADFELQHKLQPTDAYQLIWGVGYRYSGSRLKDSFTVMFNPKRRNDQLFSAFVHNEFDLMRDRLRLTLGSKFEHNDYTGFEVQPNARLTWMVNAEHTVWGAISRAVRTPAQFEHDVRANALALAGPSASCPFPGTCLVSVFGRSGYRSENLVAYELGYRGQLTKRLSLDVATFYNVYNDLHASQQGTPFVEPDPLPAHLTLPFRLVNKMDGEAFGIEASAKWNATDYWKLTFN